MGKMPPTEAIFYLQSRTWQGRFPSADLACPSVLLGDICMADGKVGQSTLAKSLTMMPALAPTRESFGYLSICLWAGITQPTVAWGCHPAGFAALIARSEWDVNPTLRMICLLPRVVLT